MVGSITIIFIGLMMVLSVGVPVAAFIYFKRRMNISWKPMLIGALIFVVFSQILEKALHVYLLQLNTQTAEWLSNPYLFAVYGGLAAGVFEEVGRYVGFRYLLKPYREWKDGLANGIGHGGIEAILVGGFGAVQFVMFAVLINSGSFESLLHIQGDTSALVALKDQLLHKPWSIFLGGWERVFAFVFHIGMSIFVLYAVFSNKKMFLLYAVLIHASYDFMVVLLTKAWGVNLFVVEGFVAMTAILALIFIIRSKLLFAKISHGP